jgi:hypothetical protein
MRVRRFMRILPPAKDIVIVLVIDCWMRQYRLTNGIRQSIELIVLQYASVTTAVVFACDREAKSIDTAQPKCMQLTRGKHKLPHSCPVPDHAVGFKLNNRGQLSNLLVKKCKILTNEPVL